jgi:hypothetical protein
MHLLFIGLQKEYDSVEREVLYNILADSDISKNLDKLISMCTNKTFSTRWCW